MSTIITIACTELHSLMARMKPAAAKPGDYTPVLQRVHFTLNGERATAVATDRYRLFMDSREVELVEAGEEDATTFTLPASAADDFKRLGYAKTVERARVEITEDAVTVVTDSARLSYPSLDAQYPRVGSLMASALQKVSDGEAVEMTTGYNPDFLADFAKVRRTGGIPKGTALRVHQIPTDGDTFQMIVTFPGTDFWGLVMGIRNPSDPDAASSATQALDRAAATAAALV